MLAKFFLNKKAQHLLEYMLVIVIAAAACIAMRTYVFRAAQATHKMIQDEFSMVSNEANSW